MRDEYSNVQPICEAFARLMDTDSSVGEVIFVDDHSSDSTLVEINACATRFPFVRALTLDGQQGKGAAIKKGFQESRCDILVMMDGDQQYTPQDIPLMLEPILAGSADLVVGKGNNHHSSTVRHVLSSLYGFAFRCMFGYPISNPNEGFKAIVKEKFDQLQITANGFDFDIELLVRSARQLLRMKEVQVDRSERSIGKSKVHILPTAVRFCERMIELRFSQRKLH
jgi:glycosyltransferase involved in cell wall biosynthesis